MKFLMSLTLSSVLSTAAIAAEKKVKVEDLPPAVQTAVKEQTQNATLVGVTTEKENGKVLYEVETTANGKSRDLLLDQSGKLIEVEEEVALDSLPAPASEAIRKKVGAGKIKKVELLTKGSEKSYEAAFVTKSGKNGEVGVNADGSPHK
jgi:uncharacterized membrane protein YkoI